MITCLCKTSFFFQEVTSSNNMLLRQLCYQFVPSNHSNTKRHVGSCTATLPWRHTTSTLLSCASALPRHTTTTHTSLYRATASCLHDADSLMTNRNYSCVWMNSNWSEINWKVENQTISSPPMKDVGSPSPWPSTATPHLAHLWASLGTNLVGLHLGRSSNLVIFRRCLGAPPKF